MGAVYFSLLMYFIMVLIRFSFNAVFYREVCAGRVVF